jgi:hypothetical protein
LYVAELVEAQQVEAAVAGDDAAQPSFVGRHQSSLTTGRR